MSIFLDVLKEEIERAEKKVSFYENKLKALPRGSIYISKVNNHPFVYLKRKNKGKVISKYIGKGDSDAAKELILEIKESKRIKANLRQSKEELCKLKRACRAYE